MIKLAGHKLCSGCGACAAVCSRSAITLCADDEGFLQPLVDESRCVLCGACEKVCPVMNGREDRRPINCYAAVSRDEALRENSSSGGVFSELANWILAKGGCVYGCVMDMDHLRAFHTKTETINELGRMRKSKYVQSEIEPAVYQDVKRELVRGRCVMFTGTPCQISGIRAFLGRDWDNLYLVALICHGVPSRMFLRKFVEQKQRRVGSSFAYMDFRSKANGWGNFSIECKNDHAETVYLEGQQTNSYMRLFNYNVAFRESCYLCQGRCGKAPFDLLIGDFWGIDKICPDMLDGRGVSAVLAYTEKGVWLMSNTDLERQSTSFSSIVSSNKNVQESESRPWLRCIIYKALKYFDFDFVCQMISFSKFDYWKHLIYRLYCVFRPALVWLGLRRKV